MLPPGRQRFCPTPSSIPATAFTARFRTSVSPLDTTSSGFDARHPSRRPSRSAPRRTPTSTRPKRLLALALRSWGSALTPRSGSTASCQACRSRGTTFTASSSGRSTFGTTAATRASNRRTTFGSRLSAHLILSWQRTHGGLRFPADVEPYPERYEEFHRLLQDNYFQAGAGASYLWRGWDLSAVFLRTVSGTNSHDVHVYAGSASRSFRLRH